MRIPTVTVTDTPAGEVEADVVLVGVHEDGDGLALTPPARMIDEAMDGSLSRFLADVAFEPKPGRVRTVASGGAVRARLVGAVGLGPAGDISVDVLRRSAAGAARSARKQGRVSMALADFGGDRRVETQAVIEGALLGSYTFDQYRSEPDAPRTTELVIVGGDSDAAARGRVLSEAAVLARDLANTPAGELPPRELAARALDMAEEGLDAEIWDLARIREERLGGLLAVSAGSVEEPRLIRLTYRPDGPARGHVALVGKGITFDSGGLSIKTAEGMETMKTDMSGAAAVLAATRAIAMLKPDVVVTTVVPSTENMPGGGAVKPGDVFRARNGKSVEILNTDAEGRLVLADGLSLAAEHEPDAMIDVATLTGACVVALGPRYGGLFSNDDDLAARVEAAATAAGEPVWRMPLVQEYRRMLDSEVADMKNIGQRHAGAITAGLFLSEFVADRPWVHLDIAGPARAERTDGWTVKGATGFATRTLVEMVDSFAAGTR